MSTFGPAENPPRKTLKSLAELGEHLESAPLEEAERTPQPLGAGVPTPEDRAAAEGSGDSTKSEKEGIPFVITRDQKQQLADLGWGRDERAQLTPGQVQDILREGRRPERTDAPPPVLKQEKQAETSEPRPEKDPWREKGGLAKAEKEIQWAVEVANGGAYPESERAYVENLLATLRTASKEKDHAAYNKSFKQLRDFADPYLEAYQEKLKNLKDPTPVERPSIAKEPEEKSEAAELARALETWQLAEEPFHSAEEKEQTKKVLAEALAELGELGSEPASAAEAPVNEFDTSKKVPEETPMAEVLRARAEEHEQKEAAKAIGEGLAGMKLEYLEKKSASLDKRYEKLGAVGKKLLSGVEWYNKLNWKTKLAISGGLVLGAAATGTALPTLSAILAGTMYAQRAVGGIGLYLNRRRAIQEKALKKDSWFYKAGKAEQNIHAAMQAVAWMGASALVGHEAIVGIEALGLGDWLAHLWPSHSAEHSTPSAKGASPLGKLPGAGAAHAAEASQSGLAFGIGHPQGDFAEPLGGGSAAEALPSVGGGAHGYEGMIEQLYAKLHAPGANYVLPADHNSDLFKIMTADKDSIGGVAHQIAADHMKVGGVEQAGRGFYHAAAGTSDVVEKGSTLGFDAHGNLSFDQGGHGHPELNAGAADDAHTTPAPGHAAPSAAEGAAAKHLAEVNAARAKLGLPPVPEDTTAASNAVAEKFYSSQGAPSPEMSHVGAQDLRYHEGNVTVPTNPPASPAPYPAVEQVPNTGGVAPVEHGVATPTNHPAPALEHATTAPSGHEAMNSPQHPNAAPALPQTPAETLAFANAHAGETHIYADAGSKHLYVWGNTPQKQGIEIDRYFANPDVKVGTVVYGTDDSGKYMIPYTKAANGSASVIAVPVRTGGFLGFFSSFAKAPDPTHEGFAKLIE